VEGAVVKIDPAADSVIFYHSLGQFYHPAKLQVNKTKNRFFLLGGNNGFTGNVTEFSFNGNTLTTIVDDSFYGLGIDPETNNIYCGRSGFTSNNYILRFTETGMLKDSVLCGIAPNSFEFYRY
jgi:hypothetical protein